MTPALTTKQAAVLAFMREFEAENDNMPTIPAIARHFGYASSNAAQGHVHALERAGCIERIRGQIGYRFTRNTACASSADAATTP